MAKIDIRLQFRRIAQALAAEAAVAGGTGHPTITGNMREILVRKFLKPHLPRSLDVRSGIIVDSNKNQSRQQDCVIVDTRLPLIDIGSDTDAIFIAESVVATIEVKSHLGSSELSDSLESIAIIRALSRSGDQKYEKGGIQIITQALPILGYIFAYDGLELGTIMEKVYEFSHLRNSGGIIPEAICVLNKGIVSRSQLLPVVDVKNRNVTLPPIRDTKLNGVPLSKDALFAFYGRLIDDVVPLQMINYDIDNYYSETGLE